MRHPTLRPLMAAGALVALAFSLNACGSSSSATAPRMKAPLSPPVSMQTASAGLVTVCKNASAPAGTYDFTVSQAGGRGGTLLAGSSFTLTPGQCTDVWQALPNPPSSDPLVTVTVTEVNLPAGVQFDSVHVETAETPTYTTSGVSVYVNYYHGALETFFNSAVPVTGGEGCTPGYWKQSQHWDSWMAPYTPSTPFADVFDNAFPGMTLEAVLSQGGGGLNALGRHTVAALLNAASPGVSYNYTVSDVINSFNNVYPGTKSDYTALKDQFAAANNQTCPLN